MDKLDKSIQEIDQLAIALRLKLTVMSYPNIILDFFLGCPEPVIVFVLATGSLKVVSTRFSSMLGYSPDELHGKNVLEFIHPEDKQVTIDAMEHSAREAIAPRPFVNRYRHRDGHYFWTVWYPQPEYQDSHHGVAYCSRLDDPSPALRAGFVDMKVKKVLEVNS